MALIWRLDRGLEQGWPEHHPPGKIEGPQGKQEGDPDRHEIAGVKAGEKARFAFFHGLFIPYCDRAYDRGTACVLIF